MPASDDVAKFELKRTTRRLQFNCIAIDGMMQIMKGKTAQTNCVPEYSLEA